jgi:hypothetical protein
VINGWQVSSVLFEVVSAYLSFYLGNGLLDLRVGLPDLLQLALQQFLLLLQMVVFALKSPDALLLLLDLLVEGLSVLPLSGLEGLQFCHFDIAAVDEVGAEGFESGEDFLLLLVLVGVGVVQDAEVAGALLVDVAVGAVAAHRVGAHAAVVLAEEVGEVAQTDHAVCLLLVRLLPLHLHL